MRIPRRGLHVAETFIRLARNMGREGQAIIGHAIGQLPIIVGGKGTTDWMVSARVQSGPAERLEAGAVLQTVCHPVFQPRAQGHNAVAGG